MGAEVALGVFYAGRDVGQVLAVGGEGVAVGHQLDVVRSAGGAHGFFGHGFALGVVGHYFEGAGRVFYVVPHQAVAGLGLVGGALGLATLALAVHKELSRGVVGVGEHGRGLALAAGPGPVRQQVQGGLGGVPAGAVQVVPVLGQAGQVQNAEVGAVRRPGFVVGRRLAEVVEASPHELAHQVGQVVLGRKLFVRGLRPRAGFQVVGRRLVIRVFFLLRPHHRKLVHAPRADGGSRFGAEQKALRQLGLGLGVAGGLVVEARHVEQGREAVAHGRVKLVHAGRDGAGGVFAVHNVLQALGDFGAARRPLVGYFVADAPQNHRRVVAVTVHHVHQVALRPFVEVLAVAVFHFGLFPLVERLHDEHDAHFIGQAHQLRGRHVVGGAHGVGAHLLQQRQLAAQGRRVHGRTQGAQIVVVAHALELARLPVQHKALARCKRERANAEAGGVGVFKHAAGV